MERSQAFGAALKQYRCAAGLTQEELAERAGLSPRAISALERGVNRAPRKATLAALTRALPLTPTERAALEACARANTRSPDLPAPQPLPARTSLLDRTLLAPAFVGRAAELDLLERHVQGEGPPVVFVTGEPGIGKSRLLHEVGRRARARGLRVVEGRGQRQSGQDPYAPLLDAIAALIDSLMAHERADYLNDACWLARLLPELTQSGMLPEPPCALAPAQERRLMFQAVSHFCMKVAAQHGLLVLLDDIQWASSDALDLFVSLAQAVAATRVRIVAAYRGTELNPGTPLVDALADLANNGLARSLTLGPFGHSEAEALVGQLLAAQPGSGHVEALLRRSGGVPFLLLHCAQEALPGEADRRCWSSVPWSVMQSIRQRVAQLPASAQELLRCSALLGTEAPLTLLYALGGRLRLAPGDVRQAVDAACRGGLLIEQGSQTYQFAHDIIREAIEDDVGPAARVELHRWIAEVLEAKGDASTTGVVAYQYIRADEWQRAASHLERAGDRALAMRAIAEAADLYAELAAGLDGLGHARWAASVREKLGAALMNMARYDDALHALRLALATYRAEQDAPALIRTVARAGEVHVLRGTPHEGLALFRSELPLTLNATPDDPACSAELALAFVAYAWLLNACGCYVEALPVAERAAQFARLGRDPISVIQADLRRSQLLLMLGELDTGARVLEEMIPLAEAAGDLRSLRLAFNSLGWVHEARGQFEQDERYTEQAFAVAERLGDPTVLAFMTSNRGGPAFNLGRWKQARQAFEAGVALLHPLGLTWASAWPPLLLGRLELAEGQWEAAELHLAAATDLAAQTGDLQALRWAQAALAERDLLRGAPEAAYERLTPLLDRPDHQESDVCPLLPLAAWAHLELGDVARAESLVEQAISRATSAGMAPALASAWRVRALLRQHARAWEAAEADLRAALTASRRMHYPYGQAILHYERGQLALRRGRADHALPHLHAAKRLLSALGERLYLDCVESLLTDCAVPGHACHGLATLQHPRRTKVG